MVCKDACHTMLAILIFSVEGSHIQTPGNSDNLPKMPYRNKNETKKKKRIRVLKLLFSNISKLKLFKFAPFTAPSLHSFNIFVLSFKLHLECCFISL